MTFLVDPRVIDLGLKYNGRCFEREVGRQLEFETEGSTLVWSIGSPFHGTIPHEQVIVLRFNKDAIDRSLFDVSQFLSA